MKVKILVTAGIFGLLAVMAAYGQHLPITAKIDFPFTVEGKALPAGQYEFVREAQGEAFRVQGEGKNAAMATIMTRLAGDMHTTPLDAHLVFDVVGGTYLLSEIWLTGEDGYMVLATKAKHEHKVMNVKY